MQLKVEMEVNDTNNTYDALSLHTTFQCYYLRQGGCYIAICVSVCHQDYSKNEWTKVQILWGCVV